MEADIPGHSVCRPGEHVVVRNDDYECQEGQPTNVDELETSNVMRNGVS